MSDNVLDTQPIKKPNIPKDATVLVVEDNVANFVLIARMLGYLGIHCEWKTSGYEVVEYADTLQRLDLILIHDAKLRLRAAWKPDPARPVVPPWAAIVLRGVP